ncbi:MAG: hypothetical protein IKE85_01745 [Mogibacterium sp.]|nr:hypothetical protein [Mogibacterium sp.]
MIAAIVLAIVSVVAFFLTEDMSNTMAYFDKYTILMAVLLIGTLITNLLGKKKSDDSEDSSDE